MKEPTTLPSVWIVQEYPDRIKPYGVEDKVQVPAFVVGGKGPATLVTLTGVPAVPVVGVSVTFPTKAALAAGIAIEEIETNNADASKTTRYRELARRVINSKHATWISRACTI